MSRGRHAAQPTITDAWVREWADNQAKRSTFWGFLREVFWLRGAK